MSPASSDVTEVVKGIERIVYVLLAMLSGLTLLQVPARGIGWGSKAYLPFWLLVAALVGEALTWVPFMVRKSRRELAKLAEQEEEAAEEARKTAIGKIAVITLTPTCFGGGAMYLCYLHFGPSPWLWLLGVLALVNVIAAKMWMRWICASLG